MAKPKKTLRERQIEAEVRGSTYLANANEAAASGHHAKAERLYEKSQFWLDRYNLLAGNADRPAPTH